MPVLAASDQLGHLFFLLSQKEVHSKLQKKLGISYFELVALLMTKKVIGVKQQFDLAGAINNHFHFLPPYLMKNFQPTNEGSLYLTFNVKVEYLNIMVLENVCCLVG